jgi:hypothetical protein
LLATALVVSVLVLRRFCPRILRVVVVVVGTVAFLGALVLCFQQISLALPAGF